MIEFARRLLHRRPKGNSGLNGREDDGGFALSDQLLEVTRPQMQSLFLDKLPLDIRLIIYSHIFPKDTHTHSSRRVAISKALAARVTKEQTHG